MIPFSYTRATDPAAALHLSADRAGKYLGGGTNLVDLMRETIERPARLVDVTALSDTIEETADGGVLIGGAARNTAIAEHRLIRSRFSGAIAGDRCRRFSPDPQHGDRSRQHSPADALRLFLRQ